MREEKSFLKEVVSATEACWGTPDFARRNQIVGVLEKRGFSDIFVYVTTYCLKGTLSDALWDRYSVDCNLKNSFR